MAITSSSQILNVSKVNLSTGILDDAVYSLNNAKNILQNAKRYCNKDVFFTNEGNTLPEQIDALIKYIEEQIASIKTLKVDVNAAAERINRNETAEYKSYLEEQENTASTNDSDNNK